MKEPRSSERCPSQSTDTSGDGIVSTAEGHPFYGHIGTSLTTNGDTSPASGLAIDRFPASQDNNSYTYRRTVTMTADVAANIRAGSVLVVHGIDPNDSGTYDGTAPSDLDPSLLLEATSPVACGTPTPGPFPTWTSARTWYRIWDSPAAETGSRSGSRKSPPSPGVHPRRVAPADLTVPVVSHRFGSRFPGTRFFTTATLQDVIAQLADPEGSLTARGT